MPDDRRAFARGVAGGAATVHLTFLTALVAGGLADAGATGEWMRLVAVAVVYGSPAVLAIVALRGAGAFGRRRALLLLAAIAALVLAWIPFSLHSYVLGPAGIAYALAYARMPHPGDGRQASSEPAARA